MHNSTEYIIELDFPRQCVMRVIAEAQRLGAHIYSETTEDGYVLNFESSDEAIIQSLCLERGIIPKEVCY